MRYNFSDLLSDEGRAYYRQVSIGARNFGCKLWNKYPKNFVSQSAGESAIRYYWNNLCDTTTQPSPPEFNGGQCETLYRISGNVIRRSSGLRVNWTTNIAIIGGKLYGTVKINGVLAVHHANLPAQTSGASLGYPQFAQVTFCQVTGVGAQINDDVHDLSTVQVTSVVRDDGQPDNCGNMPTQYPPSPSFPPEGESDVIVIDDRDNNSFSLPITYNDGTFNMPLNFTIPGATVNIDLGGVTINWDGKNELPDGSKNPYIPAPDIQPDPRSYIPQPGDPELDEKPPVEVPSGGSDGDEDEGDNKITWVEILMTQPPYEKHRIIYTDSSKNVYYYCWMNWTVNGVLNVAPEIPVRKARTILRMPEEYTGFRIGAINGAKLEFKSYTLKVPKKK